MMINENYPMLATALTALIDYATALRDSTDSSIDDAQLHADAIFDLLPSDMRTDPDFADLPPAIHADDFTDDLDASSYLDIRAAYLNLCNARP